MEREGERVFLLMSRVLLSLLSSSILHIFVINGKVSVHRSFFLAFFLYEMFTDHIIKKKA